MKKIVYLSGGIGGAKLAKGFNNLKDIDLTIIVNTGDDETIQGVKLSPDIDSCLLYTSPSPRDATLSRMPSSA